MLVLIFLVLPVIGMCGDNGSAGRHDGPGTQAPGESLPIELATGFGLAMAVWGSDAQAGFGVMHVRPLFRSMRFIEHFPEAGLFIYGDGNTSIGISGIYAARVFLQKDRFTGPYLGPGFGLQYTNLAAEDLSRKLNYSAQLLAGYRWRTQKTRFSLEFRLQHMSNGGKAYPNGGLNSSIFLLNYVF